jgi:hypothetical protein
MLEPDDTMPPTLYVDLSHALGLCGPDGSTLTVQGRCLEPTIDRQQADVCMRARHLVGRTAISASVHIHPALTESRHAIIPCRLQVMNKTMRVPYGLDTCRKCETVVATGQEAKQ